MENNEVVRKYYDGNPAHEWERMTRHPFEFEINMRFLKRYLRPGQRVLDVGGGPAVTVLRSPRWAATSRWSICHRKTFFFAKEKKARELGLELRALRRGRARPLLRRGRDV